MNKEQLSELLMSNIDNISDPYFYKSILNKNNNLSRFDIINRILIEIQYTNAYDVRTEEEWLKEGRYIKKNSRPIFIATPKYYTRYIDSETGDTVSSTELTFDEINKALEYNIIKKEVDISSMIISAVYDIKQTLNKNSDEYNIDRIQLKFSSLIKLFQNITGCSVKKADITYYYKKDNILEVSKETYSSFSQTICDLIVKYYIDNRLSDILNNNIEMINNNEISEYDYDLIESSLRYCIDTLFNSGRSSDFDIVRHTKRDKILGILNIIDSIMVDIMQKFDTYSPINNENISRSIDIAKKSEILLSIMEANSISNKINSH